MRIENIENNRKQNHTNRTNWMMWVVSPDALFLFFSNNLIFHKLFGNTFFLLSLVSAWVFSMEFLSDLVVGCWWCWLLANTHGECFYCGINIICLPLIVFDIKRKGLFSIYSFDCTVNCDRMDETAIDNNQNGISSLKADKIIYVHCTEYRIFVRLELYWCDKQRKEHSRKKERNKERMNGCKQESNTK